MMDRWAGAEGSRTGTRQGSSVLPLLGGLAVDLLSYVHIRLKDEVTWLGRLWCVRWHQKPATDAGLQGDAARHGADVPLALGLIQLVAQEPR